jgi:hypothetical protein
MESSVIQEMCGNPSSSSTSRIDSPSGNDPIPHGLICEVPTTVPTLQFPNVTLNGDEKSKKGSSNDVAFTAANTIDTLISDGTPLDLERQNPDLSNTSIVRKVALLIMFTLAEFLDAFNNSALFPAIPTISSQLHFEASETVWIISAYQLTFAAFLLVVRIKASCYCTVLLTIILEWPYIRCIYTQTSFHCRFIHSRHNASHWWFHPPEDCAPRAPSSWWGRRCTYHPVCTLFDCSTISRHCLPSSCYRSVR